jgi:hypothetical protein
MGSDWNLYLDRKLALDLDLEASRLADAIARCTLGWNSRINNVSQKFLRELARLHGRSFEHARDDLVEKGLIRVASGGRGRGKRDRYELILSGEETPVHDRVVGEKRVPGRADATAEKAGGKPGRKPGPQRGRKEKGERTPPNPLPVEDDDLLHFLVCQNCGSAAARGQPCANPRCAATPRDAGTSPRKVRKTKLRFDALREFVARVWDLYPAEQRDALIREDLTEKAVPAGLIDALLAERHEASSPDVGEPET